MRLGIILVEHMLIMCETLGLHPFPTHTLNYTIQPTLCYLYVVHWLTAFHLPQPLQNLRHMALYLAGFLLWESYLLFSCFWFFLGHEPFPCIRSSFHLISPSMFPGLWDKVWEVFCEVYRFFLVFFFFLIFYIFLSVLGLLGSTF